MTATIELNSARRKLHTALGDRTNEYFSHMKSWFRKRCTKEDFDAEARKLLPAESSHLHNEFLLAILNKCQTLVGFTTLPPPTVSSVSPTKASSPGSGMSPSTVTTINMTNNGGGSMVSRKMDLGEEGRLKYGPVKRKSKTSRPSFEQRFHSPPLSNGLAVLDAGSLELREDEDRKLTFAFREPTLPDVSMLHGRMLVSAWECGLETGVDDEAVSLMVSAVEQFLRNLISSVLMDRSGYRLRDNRIPFAVGVDCPNPWLLNTQRRARTNPQDVVSEVVTSPELSKDLTGSESDLIPLLPVGQKMFRDVEHAALVDVACASSYNDDDGAYKKSGPVGLFDLLHTLQKNRRLIPSHTVYSLNMERLISRLNHPGRDD